MNNPLSDSGGSPEFAIFVRARALLGERGVRGVHGDGCNCQALGEVDVERRIEAGLARLGAPLGSLPRGDRLEEALTALCATMSWLAIAHYPVVRQTEQGLLEEAARSVFPGQSPEAVTYLAALTRLRVVRALLLDDCRRTFGEILGSPRHPTRSDSRPGGTLGDVSFLLSAGAHLYHTSANLCWVAAWRALPGKEREAVLALEVPANQQPEAQAQ